jgi:hypothetical protein
MSKLMSVLGIMLVAVGAALALVGFVDPAQMDIYGIKMDTAAILLTGGILSIGLGGVIAALQDAPVATTSVVKEAIVEEAPVVLPTVAEVKVPDAEVKPVEKPAAEIASRVRFNPFARKSEAVAAGAAATAVVAAEAVQSAAPAVATKSNVDDTIAALEQAKADIANAIGGVASLGDEKPETPTADEDKADDEEDGDEGGTDGELYVIEEREIRGRPARILSDNTVEAETDEGWMRFENIEHLNEYLDSMGESV